MSPTGFSGTGGFAALPDDRYWADVESEDLPEVIQSKALRYNARLRRDGRLSLFFAAERTYYGFDANGGMADSTAVNYGGENGENVVIRTNHFRSIQQALIATAQHDRIAYDPRATNTDTESARQVVLAKSLLEFYHRALSLEEVTTDAARASLNFGEGYTALRWNPFVGKPVGYKDRPVLDERGNPLLDADGLPIVDKVAVLSGDVEARMFNPMEIIHDLDRASKDLDWAIVPYRENLWNLAARYPEWKDDIIALRGSGERLWARSASRSSSPWERQTDDSNADLVTVWYLYHLPCDALPKGRFAMVLSGSSGVVLEDEEMDLAEVPVYLLTPEREMTIARGHTPMWDLLALQEVYDAVLNGQITNVTTFGVQNVLAPKGTDFSPELVAKGMRLLEYTPNPDAPNGGRPEALDLLSMPASVDKFRDVIQRLMETLSGINSVIRGDPAPQLKSGAALALVQSLAIAFNGGFQSAVVRHRERVGTGLISLLKRYAKNPRPVEIVGRANKGAMIEWSGDKLDTIDRVTINVGSPLQESSAGRLEIAQQLLQNKLLKTPEQYIEVLSTGRLESAYSGEKAQLDLIARENEDLAEGKPCTVRLVDDHGIHVREHAAVLAIREIRENDAASKIVLDHINAHTQMWMAMGPELGSLTQSVAPPPPPALQAMPQGSAPKPPGPTTGPGPNAGPPAPDGRARPLGGPPPPGGPLMPTNPLTGQRAPA